MPNLKEQAIKMLQNIPDNKMIYIIEMLKCLNGIFDDKTININNEKTIFLSDSSSEASKAWEELKKYKSIIPYDIDVKAELAKARDEKYANFD